MYRILCLLVLLGLNIDYTLARKRCASRNQSAQFLPNSQDVPELRGPTRRIQGGSSVVSNFPMYSYTVRLYFKYKQEAILKYSSSGSATKCTGAILSDYWLISAAHCLYLEHSDSSRLRFDLSTGDVDFHNSYVNVGNFYFDDKIAKLRLDHAAVYPDFIIYVPKNIEESRHDLMLLKTIDNVIYGHNTKALPLPMYHDVPPYGAECEVLGWGDTRPDQYDSNTLLQVAEQYVTTPNRCYGHKFLSYLRNTSILPETVICAENRRVDLLGGDSGGPLVYDGKLVGISSIASYETLNLFTRVAYYVDWIKDTMSESPSHDFKPHFQPNITIDEAPYMARLNFYKNRKNPLIKHYICMGTVVTATRILTAAHCLFDGKSLNMAFKVRESYAEVGFDVHDRYVFQHRFIYFRVYPSYNPATYHGDMAIIATATSMLIEEVRPARIGTVGDITLASLARIIHYDNLIETNTTGQYVTDENWEKSRYLQAGLFSILPSQWCKSTANDPNDTSLMCMKSNNTYQFTGEMAGSPVMQKGVVIGVIALHDAGQIVASTLTTDIVDWLTWVLWPEKTRDPLPRSCLALRDVIYKDLGDILKYTEHMHNLQSIIPVCHDDDNMNWSSISFVVKVTIMYNTGRSPKTYSGVFIRRNVVLTAAHILLYQGTYEYNKEILAGYVSYGTDYHESDVTRYKLRHYRVHPNYDPIKKIYNAALLFVDWFSGPDSAFEYATLADPEDVRKNVYVNFAGWGLPQLHEHDRDWHLHAYNILRPIDSFVTRDLDLCNHIYTDPSNAPLNDTTSICIESENAEQCYEGDIGAPVTFAGKVIGIVSTFDPNPITGAVLTNVGTISTWLLNAADLNKTTNVTDCAEILELLDRDKDNTVKTTEHKWEIDWEIPDCADTPYLAKISLLSTRSHSFHTCTGAIISDLWVIGRASCAIGPFKASLLLDLSYMQVGQIDFTKYKIWRIITHEDYSIYDNVNDLALYESEDTLVSGTTFAKAIQITPGNDYRQKPGRVYGWEKLEKPDNPTGQQIVYEDLIIARGRFRDCRTVYLKGENICLQIEPKDGTGSEKLFNRNFGPVVYNNTLLAILSWHFTNGWTVLATNLTYYKDWIEETMERPSHKELKVFEPPEQIHSVSINLPLEQAAFMARIHLYAERHNETKFNKICIGSILSGTFILTAATCVYESPSPLGLIKLAPFKMEQSFAQLGFDVYDPDDPTLIECDLLYYIIYDKFSKIPLTDNLAVFKTKSCNMLDINPDLQVISLTTPTVDKSFIGKSVTVVSYSNLNRKEDGKITNGDGSDHGYLQRVVFKIERTAWCASPEQQIQHLNASQLLCLTHNDRFSFGTEGSLVLLEGNVIGVVSYEVGSDVVNALVATTINQYSEAWIDGVQQRKFSLLNYPYTYDCPGIRSLITYVYLHSSSLTLLNEMWNLGWIIPVCSDLKVNFDWKDATHVAKITFYPHEVCTGAFLKKDLVITSGNCVENAEPQKLLVSTGFNNERSDIVRYKVKEIAVHPDFRKDSYLVADIALLILNKESIYPAYLVEDRISTVSLGDGSDILNGETVDYWGWGVKDSTYQLYNILNKTQFTVGPLETDCQDIISQYKLHINDTFTFCMRNTSFTSEDKSIMIPNVFQGHAGGPVLNSKNVLVGVSSISKISPTGWAMKVTRLSKYYSWIQSYVNNTPRIRHLPCKEILDILKKDEHNYYKLLDHQRDLYYGLPDCGMATFIAKVSLMRSRYERIKWCVGAIVRERWVLGTAHCSYVFPESAVDLRNSYIQVGITLNTQFFLKEIFRHQHYNPTTLEHDIALYHTINNLIGWHTEATVLSLTSKNIIPFGHDVKMYGWQVQEEGEENTSFDVVEYDVEVVHTPQCRFGAEFAVVQRDKTFDGETKFCVHNRTNYIYTESQGPVVYNHTLLGMVSWGHGPIIITNVTVYEDFIEDLVQKHPDEL